MTDRVTDERRLPFYTIDDVFLKRFGKLIGPNGIAVYNALCMYANKKTGESWPSRESISEVTGLSVRAISTALAVLKRHHLVTVEGTQGGPNHYFIQPVPEQAEPLHDMQPPTLAPGAGGIARRASPPAPDAIPLAPRAPEQESGTRIRNKNQEQEEAVVTAPPPEPVKKQSSSKPKRPAVQEGAPKDPTPQQALVGALADATGMEPRLNGSRLGKAAAQLARVEATADLVRQHYGPGGWWYQCDWRGQKGEFPRPEQVIETWGQWERAAPPAVNGKPPGKGRHSEAWQKLAEGPTMIDLRLERERKAEEERRRQYGIK